jgi:hypothetical protein
MQFARRLGGLLLGGVVGALLSLALNRPGFRGGSDPI